MEHQGSALESDYFLSNAKITDLISNLTKMSKNATIESDLSQVLDEFLEKLGESDKYLQNGIFNMNFAEAALLLQSSADLYSKKVDLLWDVIFDYQKRMLLSEEQNGDKEQELEKVEERKRKYKRKRKTNSDESETTKLVNNFSFGHVENSDYLNQQYDTTDLSKEWTKFQSKETDLDEHIANKKFSFVSDERIYTEDNDYVGRYDQFHSSSLIEDIFHLEEQKLLPNNYNCVTNMRIDSYVINDFLLENSIPTTTSKDSYITELNKYISNFVHLHNHPEKQPYLLTGNIPEQLYCKSVVCLERLPVNVLKEKNRRASLADSLFGDDGSTGNCPSPCNSIRDDDPNVCKISETFDQVGGSLENRSKSCSQDSAFFEDEEQVNNEESDVGISIDQVVPVAADSTSITSESVTLGVATPIIADAVTDLSSATLESVANELPLTTGATELVAEELVTNVEIDVSEVCTKTRTRKTVKDTENTSTIVTRHKVGRKWSSDLEDSEDEEEPEIKKKKVQHRRVSAKVLKKLATGVTAKYRDFEIFCRLHYRAANGEGTVQAFVPDLEESDEDEDVEQMSEDEAEEYEEVPSPVNTDEETSDLEETQEEITPENNYKDQEIPQPENLPNLSTISPIPALNLPSTSKGAELRTSTPLHPQQKKNVFNLSDTDVEQEELCRKNVREWRSFIMPKIAIMENKADFDIHEYGSKIIEPSEIGEERHFKDIVKGKNAAEVARFFIATLQLANTYNVEIAGALPGETANNSFKIKTLDKTKHHEMLEDYQAPSEESFKERLERVKALNPKVPLHSSPLKGSPAAKKSKFTVLSMKNVF